MTVRECKNDISATVNRLKEPEWIVKTHKLIDILARMESDDWDGITVEEYRQATLALQIMDIGSNRLLMNLSGIVRAYNEKSKN